MIYERVDIPDNKSYTSSSCPVLLSNDVVDVEVGGSENLMVLLRNGTEDAAAEDTILIEQLSFSSMD